MICNSWVVRLYIIQFDMINIMVFNLRILLIGSCNYMRFVKSIGSRIEYGQNPSHFPQKNRKGGLIFKFLWISFHLRAFPHAVIHFLWWILLLWFYHFTSSVLFFHLIFVSNWNICESILSIFMGLKVFLFPLFETYNC